MNPLSNDLKRLVALVALVAFAGCCAASGAQADAQGWDGPGWYISGTPSPATALLAAPTYILFKGPLMLQGDCIALYDRFYSPIGTCRYLDAKPGGIRG
jgi:hypothetical protein